MSLKEKISRSAEAFLTVHAQNLPLQFYTSTLNGLVDLVEDEIIPTPIPMEVPYLNNVRLTLVKILKHYRKSNIRCLNSQLKRIYLNDRFIWKT